MQLLIISHKPCWPSDVSKSGFATDGGFPAQIEAVSALFASTEVAVPVGPPPEGKGGSPVKGFNLSVVPLTMPEGLGWKRKLRTPFWLVENARVLWRSARSADAIYALIPGDIGLMGLVLALLLRKPLFARYCGDWYDMKSPTQSLTRWLMERCAGGRNVMLATGGNSAPPSPRFPNVRWVFSTSLWRADLERCAVSRPHDLSRLRLITVCRQEPYKRTDLVIQAMPLLLKDFPGVSLDIVGAGSALPHLRRTAEQLGLLPRITFHGHIPQSAVIPLLQQASLFCYPTATEGFPKAVLEALACGLPVITTPVSVLPRLVPDGVAGMILENPTPENIAEAIRRCASSSAVHAGMSAAAIETACRYSLEQWNHEVQQMLAEAWGERYCAN